ncbi:hypothetical protein H2203_006525 [Taxawa tesnikishii (nom. ined.)]|nr:hypothetical protein H2203_006525 [Dothideales sp. JES 119]
MPTLAVVNFNVVCAVLGGFITLFGLVSYLLKEKFYLSEALISMVAGLIFSPHATNFIKPLDYALGDQESLDTITLYFTRLLQKIIVAESGANDGLGYPFLFLPLYLIKYTHDHGAGEHGGARLAMGLWFGETWGYTIILSVIYGAVVGWLAKELLHWAEERKYVDRESFLVFAITLALFIVGTVGMIGSDDVLACFIAGNVFTWDDWFRLETLDDSLQPTIDMLLNVSIFIWFGAVCPWYEFAHNNVIPIYRLIPLGILVLLLRRLPIVLAMHKKIHQIEELKQAIFVGFFGPIGVSAIFYLYISLDFLRQITVNGEQREDAARLGEIMTVFIWFMAICSIIVHGVSIPLGKLGLYLPRTISAAISSDRNSTDVSTDIDEPDFHPGRDIRNEERIIAGGLHRRHNTSDGLTSASSLSLSLPMPLLRLGQAIRKDINRGRGEVASMNATDGIDISAPQNPRRIGRAMDRQAGVRSNDNLGATSFGSIAENDQIP